MSKQTATHQRPRSRRAYLSVLALIPALLATNTLAEQSSAPAGNDLIRLLEQQGWQARTGSDGSIIFSPPTQAATETEAAPQPGDTLSEPRPAAAPEVERLLRQRGWRTQTDASGNTMLMRAPLKTQGGHTAEKPTPEISSEPAETTASTTPFNQFRRSLKDKGWRVETAKDGSLTIYPPVQPPEMQTTQRTATASQRGYCQGAKLTTVGQHEVTLPINTHDEAARLATDWIANFGQADHLVGRIRRINRVYSVSIVEDQAPHHLRNQLIIRAEDGGVIAID